MRLAILGFLCGVFWLQRQAVLPEIGWWPLPLLAFCTLLPVWMMGQLRARMVRGVCWIAIAISCVALGIAWSAWRAGIRLSQELPREWEARDVELTGVIASLPRINEQGARFEFDVEQIHTDGAVIPSHLSLAWYTEVDRKSAIGKPPPILTPGERWKVTVRLRRPHGTQNPHGFDFEAWALEGNIRATGYIRPRGQNTSTHEISGAMIYRIDRMRMAIRERMLTALKDQPYRGVLVALAIGEQNAIPADQWKVFWRTGTGHLMSISGLHITMVAGLIYGLMFRVWARIPALALRIPSQRAAALAGAMAALSYALIAGFSVPTQRTLFMLSAIAMALWFDRGISGSRILAWALLAVVLFDPWSVLSPGFWLSFGAVAMIFYVTANRTGMPSALSGAIRTQMAVTLGLLPLTLVLFQEVSIISPIANGFAIPVISLVVVPVTLIGAVVGQFIQADWILQLAHMIMQWCYVALAWLADLPHAVWQSHAAPMWSAALALLGAAWLLAPRGTPARFTGLTLMLPMFCLVPAGPGEGELRVDLLDVGQGLATVVRTAHHTLVYDTGPRWNPDADSGSRIVVPFLRGEGIRELDGLIITHADDDHSGGAKSVIDARRPAWVMTSMDPASENLRGAIELRRCRRGDAWQWDGVDFVILHPESSAYEDAKVKTNNLGCTLKITSAGGTILMTADIEKVSEQQLLARFKDQPEILKADIMVVPHHGSRTSSTEAFLDAVSPTMALVPVGYRSRFRHPNAQVMERYADRGIPVFRTDFLGAITISFVKGVSPALTSYRETHLRYWLDPPLRDAESAEP